MSNARIPIWFLVTCIGCAGGSSVPCPEGWSRERDRCRPAAALGADAGILPIDAAGTPRDAATLDARDDASGPADASGPTDAAVDVLSGGDAFADGSSGHAGDAAPGCDPRQRSVRLHELLIDPDGADGGREFVELAAEPGVRLDGMRLVHRNGAAGEPYAEYAIAGEVGASGRWVLGGEAIVERDAPLPAGLQNGPDGLELIACDGTTIDAVVYGGDAFAWRSGEGAEVLAGMALVSCGTDVTPDAARWQSATATPGQETAPLPDACTPCLPVPAGAVLINEVRYDPPGADGAGEAEFIELLALTRAPAGALSLVLVEGRDGEAYHAPVPVPALEAGQYLVLGGVEAGGEAPLPRALQNGPDGLALVDCLGARVDALGYGDVAQGVAEGDAAPEAPGGVLGRRYGAVDTDNNERDFAVLARPTPGAPNVP